jgi:hypothetical protein
MNLPRLTIQQILAWADAYHRQIGTWPTCGSGTIPDTRRETWRIVNNALIDGLRGLSGGHSLARVLAEHRGVRHPKEPPPLQLTHIVAWADAYHRRTGRWPTNRSGPIQECAGETWFAVNDALSRGRRGLKGGSSLARLLMRRPPPPTP